MIYNEDKVVAVLALLRLGNTLKQSCRDVGIFHVDFLGWMETHSDLEQRYLDARKTRAHSMADECLEIADAATRDTAHVARLQVDTRKWLIARMHPTVYGDKVQVDANVSHKEARELSTEELTTFLASRRPGAQAALDQLDALVPSKVKH